MLALPCYPPAARDDGRRTGHQVPAGEHVTVAAALRDLLWRLGRLPVLSVPFVVVVNTFHGERPHQLEAVRQALQIGNEVPMGYCDARNRNEVQRALIELVEHALVRARRSELAG